MNYYYLVRYNYEGFFNYKKNIDLNLKYFFSNSSPLRIQ